MRAVAVAVALLVGGVPAIAAEIPETPTCLSDVVREWCPGFLAIEPDTWIVCVWWFHVRRPDHSIRRFHFPTRVRCEEARRVAAELHPNVEERCR